MQADYLRQVVARWHHEAPGWPSHHLLGNEYYANWAYADPDIRRYTSYPDLHYPLTWPDGSPRLINQSVMGAVRKIMRNVKRWLYGTNTWLRRITERTIAGEDLDLLDA